MEYLARERLIGKGSSLGLLAKNTEGQPQFLAFTWLDREHRFFISTTSSLSLGTNMSRDRLKQLVPT
jgi:hypothetical protein